MKVGLYFGSFNPIHLGHLIIANSVINSSRVKQVWFIVSPQNPFKETGSLLNEYDRLHLVKCAIETNPAFRASDIEFKLPRPSYTIDTLTYLSEKYPENDFTIILGSDSFQNINKWKNSDILVRDYSFLVYERPGFEIVKHHNAYILQAPLLEISATQIRQLIKEGKSIQYLVSDTVKQEIEKNSFYK